MRSTSVLFALLLAPIIVAAQPAKPPEKPGKPPEPKDLPQPPSTGRELAAPKTLPPAVQAEIARRLIKSGTCRDKVAVMATAMSMASGELTSEERLAGNAMLHKCAYAAKAWRSVLSSSLYLIEVAPEQVRPSDVIEALLNMGDEDKATQVLKALLDKFPKLAAELTVGISLIACHKSDFTKCHTASSKVLDLLAKMKSPPADAVLRNRMYHAVAAASLGKWAEYDADMAVVEEMSKTEKRDLSRLKRLRAGLEAARTTKLFIDTDHARQLPLGTYHYMAGAKVSEAGEVLTLRFVNQAAVARSIKVEVQVPGITEPMKLTLALPPGEQITQVMSPPLKMDFDVGKLRAPRQSQITLKVTTDRDRPLYEQSYEVEVLPRDHLPLRRSVGSDIRRTTFSNALAWITPNATEIEAFLGKAKERIEKRKFVGEQRETLPQVKALFEELRARGVSYVMDPSVFDEIAFYQRTRLPAEVLASTNAQCLEGTLLYATLMEAIGLQPILVFVPGHAFVAWKASSYDKGGAKMHFLETTLTGGTASFEQAVEVATRRYAEEVKLKHFLHGASALIDVKQLRTKGYTPQPY